MQKFLKKREVVSFSLCFEEKPRPEDFTRLKTVEAYGLRYYELPDGSKHGKLSLKTKSQLGVSEETAHFSFGLLHGEFHSTVKNDFVRTKETKGTFWNGKPHGEFSFDESATAFYEHGRLLRHTCQGNCPYLCSGNTIGTETEWEWQEKDILVRQKPFGQKDWDVIVRYKSIYFDEPEWMSLPYGRIGTFSSPVPDVPSGRVYAKSCVFEKGKGKSIRRPLVIPYFLY
ncbi:hypothetical protein [Brazilian marseillevirus]|uniref:hypothetical protein n=1 Tax=Brazilian marseillevirus TaxID=1813599 RepID=UPI000782345F|nr:hypothetical protein A3303_gp295 [Brazilian marseillevirus]AMQ10803.1 hypothetical protein [Brazilian marseillevirus]